MTKTQGKATDMEKQNQGGMYTISTTNHKLGCDGTDLIDTARKAVQHLATLCEDDGKGRLFGHFRIKEELGKAGFKTGIPHLVLFLQFAGLVRKLGKDGNCSLYRYQVLDPTFFDCLVSAESVKATLSMMHKRKEMQRRLVSLQKQVSSLESKLQERAEMSTTATFDEATEQLLTQMAELAALVEELRNEKISLADEIVQLKQKLSEQPSVDPAAIAAQMVARAKEAL